jgi:hypothetical protein
MYIVTFIMGGVFGSLVGILAICLVQANKR